MSALAGALLALACNEQQLQPGFEFDEVPPAVSIDKTGGDTMDVAQGVSFTVNASDNLGLRSVSVDLTGGLGLTIDTVFSSQVTSLVFPVLVVLDANTTAGGVILITATAVDGSDNADTAVDSVFLDNEAALSVSVNAPNDGAVTSAGKQIPVEIVATQRDGVRKVGYLVSGAFTGGDSIGPLSALPSDVTFQDTLDIPSSATSGTFTITGFAEDSSARRATGTPVTVTIQDAASDQDPPLVTVTIAERVEVDDSIAVNATDPSGITEIGWMAALLDGTPVAGDTNTYSGNLTDITQRWELGFDFTSLPQSVIITAHAVDGAGNVGTSQGAPSAAPPAGRAAAAAAVDTVVVVNGVTRALPDGGRIADAIYNPNLNEIYLTNWELDRLEVFQVTDSTFDPDGIPVGSRPWGIALWPRDTLGTNGDSVVVANSGGTNLSIVDVSVRLPVRRQALPIFRVQSVQSKIDPATGLIKPDITEYTLSDRPQFIGMMCRTAGGTACAADSIIAVYSTTPTAGQSTPFTNRATIRWENLTSGTPESHFFWEHASELISDDKDTLQVLTLRGDAEETLLHALCGEIVSIEELGFLDTTFVRNSGNFTHALIGEGGSSTTPALAFARALAYDASEGVDDTGCQAISSIDSTAFPPDTTFTTLPDLFDRGISRSISVRDFIANTAIPVKSIGINFNGMTNLIRADSIYVLDENLRLQGLISVNGTNPGMDLNFNHAFDAGDAGTPTFGGSLNPNDRFVFAASADPVVDVFDTFFYAKVATVPIRDPVIGPLRVAALSTGEQILVGVTVSGVVVIQLPAITNVFPAEAWGAPRP